MTFVFSSVGHTCSANRTVAAVDAGESPMVVVSKALGRHVTAGIMKGCLLSSIGFVRPSSFKSSISFPSPSVVIGLS